MPNPTDSPRAAFVKKPFQQPLCSLASDPNGVAQCLANPNTNSDYELALELQIEEIKKIYGSTYLDKFQNETVGVFTICEAITLHCNKEATPAPTLVEKRAGQLMGSIPPKYQDDLNAVQHDDVIAEASTYAKIVNSQAKRTPSLAALPNTDRLETHRSGVPIRNTTGTQCFANAGINALFTQGPILTLLNAEEKQEDHSFKLNGNTYHFEKSTYDKRQNVRAIMNCFQCASDSDARGEYVSALCFELGMDPYTQQDPAELTRKLLDYLLPVEANIPHVNLCFEEGSTGQNPIVNKDFVTDEEIERFEKMKKFSEDLVGSVVFIVTCQKGDRPFREGALQRVSMKLFSPLPIEDGKVRLIDHTFESSDTFDGPVTTHTIVPQRGVRFFRHENSDYLPNVDYFNGLSKNARMIFRYGRSIDSGHYMSCTKDSHGNYQLFNDDSVENFTNANALLRRLSDLNCSLNVVNN